MWDGIDDAVKKKGLESGMEWASKLDGFVKDSLKCGETRAAVEFGLWGRIYLVQEMMQAIKRTSVATLFALYSELFANEKDTFEEALKYSGCEVVETASGRLIQVETDDPHRLNELQSAIYRQERSKQFLENAVSLKAQFR